MLHGPRCDEMAAPSFESRNGIWTPRGDIGMPLRTYQSLGSTVAAWIRTRISSDAGTGASTSAIRRTPGGP